MNHVMTMHGDHDRSGETNCGTIRCPENNIKCLNTYLVPRGGRLAATCRASNQSRFASSDTHVRMYDTSLDILIYWAEVDDVNLIGQILGRNGKLDMFYPIGLKTPKLFRTARLASSLNLQIPRRARHTQPKHSGKAT